MKRRFLQVGSRRVHYFRAGDGPPAVLVHSSPANARLLRREIIRLAANHTVFAFDTPGFGLSDALPDEDVSVQDLADALAETLEAIGMPRCPVFGTHTGAAIALELGVRHPSHATGLVLDGVAVFTAEECDRFFQDYFRVLPLSDLGGHYGDAWTRFRDQSVWFPWNRRLPECLNRYDLGSAASTQLWVEMYFESAETYIPAYRAASFYGARAIDAVSELTLPAAFCATESDMLYAHLERLPPMRPGQAIVPIGDSTERKRDLIAERFAAYGATGRAPEDRDVIGSATEVTRQFVDGETGQIHLRYAGDRRKPALILFHDAPGSSEQAEPLITDLAKYFFVVAPDLPGCGESDAHKDDPTIDDFAETAAMLIDRLLLGDVTVYGIGFGASAALAFARRHADCVSALAVQGLLLPEFAERANIARYYAPVIDIEPDGSHWYRTWLMLRDSQIYWPWYDRRKEAQRHVKADFSARPLHRWTMDVMRSRATYGGLVNAAIAASAAAALATLDLPLVQVRDRRTPLSAHDYRLAGVRPPDLVIDAAVDDVAGTLASALSSLWM